MNVALVYDRVNKFGGAERVLLALHKIWPKAPLYTAVYDPNRAPWANVFDVRPSFLQNIPFVRRHHEFIPWLMPMAFASFIFDDYDVVVSVTSAEAKGIVTKPGTLHICYVLTSTRYLWSGFAQYQRYPGLGIFDWIAPSVLRHLTPTLRRWDLVSAHRPDTYVAISRRIKDRVETYYDTPVDRVLYPPLDRSKFTVAKNINGRYFLTVSRLVGYKRVDIVIDAFNRLGLPLKIIGDGRAKSGLRAKAKKNIEFIDRHLTDDELNSYYQRCLAFVFAGDEDFGLVAAEAQATGAPVICYKHSGMAEIIQDGKTGILFEEQSVDSLLNGIERFHQMRYNKDIIRRHAAMFDQAKFTKAFYEFTQQQLSAHTARRRILL